jgi:hypothetical protein
MKLSIQVLDESNSVVFDDAIEVPNEVPYPPPPSPQSGPITLAGLKTAIDYYMFAKSTT